MKKISLLASLTVLMVATQFASAARSNINIVGSSTVYPFSTVVAERFGRSTDFKTPKVESTGSGGGMKLFCQGVGIQHPDITNSSRRIKKSEFELCKKNGVNGIVEVLIGYDGIVIANSREAEQMSITRKDLFLALAAQIPNPNGTETLISNPNRTWKDVNASLPNIAIEVLGPPPTSGTRDAFSELALEGGCKSFSWIKDMKKKDKKAYKSLCHTVREDGAYIEAGENDNLIVQKLNANKDALGIFGFSFLDQNIDQVQASIVDGNEPTFETIADGYYPVSRPLYFYVKKAHVGVVPGMVEYLAEFTSESTWGDFGYLTEKGMIPLNKAKRTEIASDVKNLRDLAL
jgi:phosphate transport system substrate-binding protein